MNFIIKNIKMFLNRKELKAHEEALANYSNYLN